MNSFDKWLEEKTVHNDGEINHVHLGDAMYLFSKANIILAREAYKAALLHAATMCLSHPRRGGVYYMRKFTCLRCTHSWYPRKLGRPAVCAKCHSALWFRQKESKSLAVA